MIDHLRALASSLSPLGYPVHLLRANPQQGDPEGMVPAVPYLVLRSGTWASDEMPLADETAALATEVRVTGAATTAEGAMTVLGRVRGLWSPRSQWTRLDVMPGRLVHVRFARTEIEAQVDLDLRLPGTNRHPGFGVDSYLLRSEPI